MYLLYFQSEDAKTDLQHNNGILVVLLAKYSFINTMRSFGFYMLYLQVFHNEDIVQIG